jgi:hypothetical protein
VTVVIATAVIPTVIAQRFFEPHLPGWRVCLAEPKPRQRPRRSGYAQEPEPGQAIWRSTVYKMILWQRRFRACAAGLWLRHSGWLNALVPLHMICWKSTFPYAATMGEGSKRRRGGQLFRTLVQEAEEKGARMVCISVTYNPGPGGGHCEIRRYHAIDLLIIGFLGTRECTADHGRGGC